MTDAVQQTEPKKIAIIGAGNIGMKLMEELHRQYPDTDIVVWNREKQEDAKKDTKTGAAMSGDQAKSISTKLRRGNSASSAKIHYTTDLAEAMQDSDIVAVTGGIPRKSSTQPREDLAKDNIPFITPIAEAAKQLSAENPDWKPAFFIGTNPVDLIAHHFQNVSGLPSDRIVGLGGELDVERLRQSIRLHLGLDGYDKIRGEFVVGDHGPNMVPVLSNIEVDLKGNGHWEKLLELKDGEGKRVVDKIVRVPSVDGKSVEERPMLKEFENATKKGGGKFADWTGQSDFRAPAAAIAYMIEQYVDAKFGNPELSLPITCSTYSPEHNVYTGKPVQFMDNGAHTDAAMPPMSEEEVKFLQESIEKAKESRVKFQAMARVNDTARFANAVGM